MDEQLKNQFEDITRTILSNQTEALSNLTKKVEKEIGQVWRQMGIMYGQVSNSISILEKVKASTEGYVNNTSKNLGTMEGIKYKNSSYLFSALWKFSVKSISRKFSLK